MKRISTAVQKTKWFRDNPLAWEGYPRDENHSRDILNAMIKEGLYSPRTPVGDAMGRMIRTIGKLRKERRDEFKRINVG